MKSDPERALGTIAVTEQTGLAVKHDDSNIKVRVFSCEDAAQQVLKVVGSL